MPVYVASLSHSNEMHTQWKSALPTLLAQCIDSETECITQTNIHGSKLMAHLQSRGLVAGQMAQRVKAFVTSIESPEPPR